MQFIQSRKNNYVTTGASNDIQRATEIARNMVTKWGLSDTMGPLMYDEGGEEVFLGRTAAQPSKAMSDETALAIDKEVRSIIDECYEKARSILEEHRSKMDMMADALMQYETIDSEQIDAIMEGKKPNPPSDWTSGPTEPPSDPEASSGEDTVGDPVTH